MTSAQRRAMLVAAACAAAVTACTDGGGSGDISAASDLVATTVDGLTSAYTEEIGTGPAEVRFDDVSDSACPDGEQRVRRQVVVPVGAFGEGNNAVEDATSVWNSWSQETDDSGAAVSAFATDDVEGNQASYSVTTEITDDGSTVTLNVVVVTDGADGANVVVDAYSDCLQAADD